MNLGTLPLLFFPRSYSEYKNHGPSESGLEEELLAEAMREERAAGRNTVDFLLPFRRRVTRREEQCPKVTDSARGISGQYPHSLA